MREMIFTKCPGNPVRMYYGCADTCIGLATAKLEELVDFTLNGENRRIRKFFRTIGEEQ